MMGTVSPPVWLLALIYSGARHSSGIPADDPPQCSLWRLQVEEKTVAQLLPFLLPGLKAKDCTEYQLATYMLLMRLITRCSPSPQLFNGEQRCDVLGLCARLLICCNTFSQLGAMTARVLMMRIETLEVSPVTSLYQFVFPEAPFQKRASHDGPWESSEVKSA